MVKKSKPKLAYDPIDPSYEQKPLDLQKYLKLPVLNPPVRQSNIGHYQQCPRYFMFRDRFGLVKKGYKSAASRGTMVHLVLSMLLKGHDYRSACRHLNAFVEAESEKLREWGVTGGNPLVADRQVEQVERDGVIAAAMAQIFWERVPFDRSRYEVVSVEQELRLEHPLHRNAILGGTIDLILRDKVENCYLLQDHKTTSLRPRDYAIALPFDYQVRLYRLMFETALRSGVLGLKRLPLRGFIHNVIQVPKITQKNGQSFDDFLQELRDWYDGKDDSIGEKDENDEPIVFKKGARKGKIVPRWEHSDKLSTWAEAPPFERFLTRFTEPLLSHELKHAILGVATALAKEATDVNFPRMGAASGMCKQHYGRPCEFMPLCSVHPCNWEGIVKRQYDVDAPTMEEAE